MKRAPIVQTALLIFLTTFAFGQQLFDPILLWPEGAPGATGTSREDKPAITTFIPHDSIANGTAMLVIPGGGFTIRAVDHEGVLVAQWLKKQGITAFLLRYRLRPMYDRENWLLDGQRALQYIRAHASEYNISPDRVGAVGFSAGANLCADMAFNAAPGNADAADPLDRHATNPNFIVLGYGSAQMPDTIPEFAREHLPPVFLYGTATDKGATRGMASLLPDLVNADVSVETHIFQSGEHGSGFAIGDPILGEWPNLMMRWIKTNGMLSAKKRVSITGVVNLNGKPLPRGMIVLTPMDDPNVSSVTIYMTNTGTGQLGRFTIPSDQGPIEGRYTVEVREEATRWTSNSRAPFMIEMGKKRRAGTLTDTDIEAWSAYLRKRDLSPSIDDQHVYSHRGHDQNEKYIINIKEGEELLIEVFSK